MIDWDRVHELQQEVGQEDFDEIVALFMEEVDTAMDALSPTLDGPAAADALHFLKGCALNLGFRALADLCAACERTAQAGATDPACMARIKPLYAASRTAFLSRIATAA